MGGALSSMKTHFQDQGGLDGLQQNKLFNAGVGLLTAHNSGQSPLLGLLGGLEQADDVRKRREQEAKQKEVNDRLAQLFGLASGGVPGAPNATPPIMPDASTPSALANANVMGPPAPQVPAPSVGAGTPDLSGVANLLISSGTPEQQQQGLNLMLQQQAAQQAQARFTQQQAGLDRRFDAQQESINSRFEATQAAQREAAAAAQAKSRFTTVDIGGGAKGLLDVHTGQIKPLVSADLIAQNEAKVEGAKTQARETVKTQQANVERFQGMEDQLPYALQTLQQLRDHPGREWATGKSGYLPGWRGSDKAGFTNLHEQVKAQSFRQVFESLKGAGQITETEGKVATQALNRLNTDLSDKEYLDALDELYGVLQRAYTTAGRRAGVTPGVPTVSDNESAALGRYSSFSAPGGLQVTF